jgi:hypothetical protein
MQQQLSTFRTAQTKSTRRVHKQICSYAAALALGLLGASSAPGTATLLFAQDQSVHPTAPADSKTRPCPAAQAETTAGDRNKATHIESETAQREIRPACLEVKAGVREIQEFLQKTVREQGRNVGQVQISANSFSFYRHLDKDELAQAARTDILGGRISWTEGKAFVSAQMTGAGEGFTRVQISARFQGRGQTSERFARPSDLWPLMSRGTLEGSLLSALESYFHSST